MSIVDAAPPPYYPELPITKIQPHSKNPRHRAIADPDMVDSVRVSGVLEPLIVAPTEPGSDTFILIAGHRRLDATKKAKKKTAPAVVRYDLVTEGQQIEAMIIENGHREDLTPVEEAEGYHQLELLGYKAPAIATAVGRDVKTVRARVKLLSLNAATREKVHTGDLTLEDAAALVEFADDKAATKRITAAAEEGRNFRYVIEEERRKRKAAREAASAIAKLLDAGATQYVLPSGKNLWEISREGGPVSLASTHSDAWSEHIDCLGYLEETSGYFGMRVIELCLKPDTHRDQLDADERKRIEEIEAEHQEREAQRAAVTTAGTVRVSSVAAAVDGQKVPKPIANLVRGLLPLTLRGLNDDQLGIYFDHMGLEPGQRWKSYGSSKATFAAIADHVGDLVAGTDVFITRALVGALLASAESIVVNQYARSSRRGEITAYFDYLISAGHPMCDVDLTLHAEAAGSTDRAEVA